MHIETDVTMVVMIIQFFRNSLALIPCVYASLSPDRSMTIFHLRKKRIVIPIIITGAATASCRYVVL